RTPSSRGSRRARRWAGPAAASARRRSTGSSAFFFSSRRRHTRSKRDWSSDVCSSDLHTYSVGNHENTCGRSYSENLAGSPDAARSEERRVGKECRAQAEPAERDAERGLEQRRGGDDQQASPSGGREPEDRRAANADER